MCGAWHGRAAAAAEEDLAIVDGPRERKATTYGDQLNDRDFTRWAQSGLELDEWKQQEEERKRRLEEKGSTSSGGGRPAKKAR